MAPPIECSITTSNRFTLVSLVVTSTVIKVLNIVLYISFVIWLLLNTITAREMLDLSLLQIYAHID